MSYESRFYFVRPYSHTKKGCEVIAVLNAGCLGHSPEVEKFLKLFNTPIDFSLYIPGSDDDSEKCYRTTDCYGDKLKTGDTNELFRQIDFAIYAAEQENGDQYWRYYLLRDMLFSFRVFNDVKVIHYGY